MNARLLAQEVSNFYLENLDPYERHSSNVKNILRKLILNLTIKILHPDVVIKSSPLESCLEIEDDVEKTKSNSRSNSNNNDEQQTIQQNQPQQDWRQYLRRVDSNGTLLTEDIIKWNQEDQELYDTKLGRRTKARMNAFIDGCIYSLPSEENGEDHNDNKNTTASLSFGTTTDNNTTTASFFRNSNTSNNNGRKKSGKKKTSNKNKMKGNVVPIVTENKNEIHGDGLPSLTEALSGFSVSSFEGRPHDGKSSSVATASRTKVIEPATSSSRSTNKNRNDKEYRIQFTEADNYHLTVRVELYIRTLTRVKSLNKECVICEEPIRAMNARIKQIVVTFIEEVGCVSLVTPVLTKLVSTLTKELLAVTVLGENIQKIIQRFVVEDYIHQTSFGSLAFLSTPEKSADTKLTPILQSYINYLKKSSDLIAEECEVEYFLSRTLDSTMRYYFKNVEFQSIGHLLDVCSTSEIKEELQNINLPPDIGGLQSTIKGNKSLTTETALNSLCLDTKVVKQAIRDLQREIITVNGHVLPPAKSRKDLVNLLAQTLNTTPATRRRASNVNKVASAPLLLRTPPTTPTKAAVATPVASIRASPTKKNYLSGTDSDILSGTDSDILSSGNEYVTPPSTKKVVAVTTSSNNDSSNNKETNIARRRSSRRRRSSMSMKTVDRVTRRLLLATSRTGTGGDAYFVVRDLFGGDDVEVIPSSQQQRQQQILTSAYGDFDPNPPTNQGNVGRSSIEIVVRLASVTIKCHGSFDVYPKPLNGCSEPLIQIHTTTSETITLHEVRACDCDDNQTAVLQSGDNVKSDSGSATGTNQRGSELILQEKQTDKTGWRTLSIRPALYEMVEVFNTPS